MKGEKDISGAAHDCKRTEREPRDAFQYQRGEKTAAKVMEGVLGQLISLTRSNTL